MGTRVLLTTYAETRAGGLTHLEQMLDVIERTDSELSTWRSDSEVSRLNAAAGGGAQHLSPAMCRLLSDLDRHVTATAGAFDPAIGALTAAWDLHGGGAGFPRTASWPTRARTADGTASPSTRIAAPWSLPAGVSIDVGAFGKGLALDRVRAGVPGAAPWLIDLGGQIAVSALSPGEDGVPVALAHPWHRSTPALSLNDWRWIAGDLGGLRARPRDPRQAGRPYPRSADGGAGSVRRVGVRVVGSRARCGCLVDGALRDGPGRGDALGRRTRRRGALPGSGCRRPASPAALARVLPPISRRSGQRPSRRYSASLDAGFAAPLLERSSPPVNVVQPDAFEACVKKCMKGARAWSS